MADDPISRIRAASTSFLPFPTTAGDLPLLRCGGMYVCGVSRILKQLSRMASHFPHQKLPS